MIVLTPFAVGLVKVLTFLVFLGSFTLGWNISHHAREAIRTDSSERQKHHVFQLVLYVYFLIGLCIISHPILNLYRKIDDNHQIVLKKE